MEMNMGKFSEKLVELLELAKKKKRKYSKEKKYNKVEARLRRRRSLKKEQIT